MSEAPTSHTPRWSGGRRGKSGCARRLPVIAAAAFLLGVFGVPEICSQDLEPRALTNVPVGTQFLIAGYAYSTGNVLLDPAIPIEGLDANLHTLLGATSIALDLFGKSSKVTVLAPFSTGSWTGKWEGQDASRSASGFGDPKVALSMNLIGAPAVDAEDFSSYTPGTTFGVSLRASIPLGEYDEDELLNLGSNRWTFKARAGVSHPVDEWTLEGYVSVWLFTENPEFVGGNTLEQRPFLGVTTHVIRSLPKDMWIAFDLGFGTGARGVVNGVERDNRQTTFRFGGTFAVPIASGHSLKLTVASAAAVEAGPDFDVVALTYQYRWGAAIPELPDVSDLVE